jgi:hypothetical protein
LLHAQLLSSFAPQHNLYAVLEYNPAENKAYTSPLASSQQGLYQWGDCSDSFKTTPESNLLRVRLFQKNFYGLWDCAVGEGEAMIDRLGSSSVAIWCGEHKGGECVF